MNKERQSRPKGGPLHRVRGALLLDTGPLIDLVALKTGLSCALSKDFEAVKKIINSSLGKSIDLSTVCPVYTETLHIVARKCKLNKRRDANIVIKNVVTSLKELEEIASKVKDAMDLVDSETDLADAALLVLASRGNHYTILTHDLKLRSKARIYGAHAITVWELASLL